MSEMTPEKVQETQNLLIGLHNKCVFHQHDFPLASTSAAIQSAIQVCTDYLDLAAEAANEIQRLRNNQAALREKLEKIAAIAHHGALIGHADIFGAMAEIRTLTLDHWNSAECDALQDQLEGDRQ